MDIQPTTRLLALSLLLGTGGLLPACNESGGGNGTSPTVTITAPVIVSPADGSQVSEARPTLTVSNATVSDGSTPTYNFQVALDSGFTNMVAQVLAFPQGSGGQTSWRVNETLAGSNYFWRVRARSGNTEGPFSSVAEFSVGGGLSPGDVVLISDPLTNGASVGEVHGGQFTDRGWKVNTNADFIRYEVNALSKGFVQWNNVGLLPRGFNADSHMLFGMWDPSVGGFRTNPYRVNLQKLWAPTHNPPFLRLRWISGGEEHDTGINFTNFDPGQTYTWRVQWGPAAGANTAKVFLDGVEKMQIRYGRAYLPNTHWIEMGIAERQESVIDAVYFNVLIGRRQ
jgi:hypothetical protein